MWSLLLLLPACLALRDLEPPPPPPAVTSRSDDVITGFVDVRKSHFHAPYYDQTFPMRYMYNGALVRGDISALVIFVGGEWSISAGWLTGGLAYELASTLGAGLVYTEHRYYGESRPESDTSVPNLRWLTVDQALGDLAQFIQFAKSDAFQDGIFKDAKVVLVGCSYAGSMATWARLALPHLVSAAFSDSGPLRAQLDFPEYLELITEAIRVQGGEGCVDSIREGVVGLHALVNSDPGRASSLFNTCTPLQATSALDRATFFWTGVTETFAYLVQYAAPGDIRGACSILTDQDVADATQRLANFITAHPWSQPCIETRYSEILARHTNTSFDAPDTHMRLWTYQTCVEFGWYQSTSGEHQVFLDSVPLDFFHQMCRDFFSSYYDEERTSYGVERTNTMFGGLTYLPDHTVTVQGGHDPWSPVGPNVTHQTPLAPVYVVPQISHCRAIYGTASSETEELALVKTQVLEQLARWTAGDSLHGGSTPLLASALLVAALALLA